MKYLNPRSLTFWSGTAMIVAGLVQAAEPIHGWGGVSDTLHNIYAAGPAALINAGLATIGLRAALVK